MTLGTTMAGTLSGCVAGTGCSFLLASTPSTLGFGEWAGAVGVLVRSWASFLRRSGSTEPYSLAKNSWCEEGGFEACEKRKQMC